MRYASLKFIKLIHFKFTIIYIINMLFIIFIQDLYKRFNKKKRVIFILNKVYNFLTNQNAAFNFQKSRFKCLNSIIKISLTIIKSNN